MYELIVFIKVVHNSYLYDELIVTNCCIINTNCNIQIQKKSNRRLRLYVDGILMHYFINELHLISSYRHSFINNFYNRTKGYINQLDVVLVPTSKEIIDYGWNYRMAYLVRERCELEHALSWLSTLGGAFSALGDYFTNCAAIAGKISINQLKLAFRLGDPNIVSRCKLYLSLSLIQQNRFKLAKRIVHNEYVRGKNKKLVDTRLINMCKGIWCKLKYEYNLYKQ